MTMAPAACSKREAGEGSSSRARGAPGQPVGEWKRRAIRSNSRSKRSCSVVCSVPLLQPQARAATIAVTADKTSTTSRNIAGEIVPSAPDRATRRGNVQRIIEHESRSWT
jgi:hypothetical protein